MKGIARTIVHLLALLSAKFVLLVLFFFLCIFVLFHLVHDVFHQSDTDFDSRMFHIADKITSPAMTDFMRYVSFLGSDEYLLVASALIVLIFTFYKGMHWNSLRLLMITFTCSMLNKYLKHYYDRPRPNFSLVEVTGLSFPSGHAMIGGIFYALLIYIVWETVQSKVWRWVLSTFFTLLIMLIGFSRIYLKVHYATDVVAGYIIGIIWLILSLYLLRKIEKVYLSKYKH